MREGEEEMRKRREGNPKGWLTPLPMFQILKNTLVEAVDVYRPGLQVVDAVAVYRRSVCTQRLRRLSVGLIKTRLYRPRRGRRGI